MIITVRRDRFTDVSTLGMLSIDGEPYCYTLEDTDRQLENGGAKVYGKTAIPRGRYRVTITHSQRFNRPLPLLHDVPQFLRDLEAQRMRDP